MSSRLVLAALLLAACKRSAPVDSTLLAASYDRTCEHPSDCVPVFEGDVRMCSARPGCPNAAISNKAAADYFTDFNGLASPCTPEGLNSCPNSGLLKCAKGQCEFQRSPLADPAAIDSVDAADYGQTCSDVADCVTVYLGPIGCCSLPCPNAVISAADLPRYMSDLDQRTAICYPQPPCTRIPGCANGRVACTDGKCELLFAPPDGAALD